MNRNRRARLLFPALALALLAGCRTGTVSSQSEWPVVPACFVAGARTVPVVLELASTPEQRRVGLMGRSELPANHGMLFRYPEERSPSQGFWMYRTRLPLDIAFLDRQDHILRIRSMIPCLAGDSAGCPTYPAGVPYWSAVEMNAGFYQANQIEVGDRLRLGNDCHR